MRYAVAIVGEAWESPFARATARALAGRLAPETELLVPAELARAVQDVVAQPLRAVAPVRPGFHAYAQMRERVLATAGAPVLVVAAGVMPSLAAQPAAYAPRVVEWASREPAPGLGGLAAPVHGAPPVPAHRRDRIGGLDVWEVDGGERYFQTLLALAADGPPVWPQYGPRAPVFAYNTNDFAEPRAAAHEQYAVLASGVLGLKLIAESEPPANAAVVVYDINPDQLAWTRFLLANAARIPALEAAAEEFARAHPAVAIRPVEPHERANAGAQSAWYARHHARIAELGASLRWTFLRCDLLANPAPLLAALEPGRDTLCMYLDLFVVWHVDAERPWVESHAGMARSFESAVRERVGGARVTFVPGAASRRFQLAPESPFRREMNLSCT